MRVALAATLFSEPDLLLLDEPTNYLDLEGTLWLEEHIARYPRTVIVISHDRDLLDRAVNTILHIDGGKLAVYHGDYSSFERQRRERLTLDLKLAKAQEAERKRIEGQGVADFQRIVSAGLTESLLRWKGIEATTKLAESGNAKMIVIGGGKDGLPLILNP